jgi:hypothetical protein
MSDQNDSLNDGGSSEQDGGAASAATWAEPEAEAALFEEDGADDAAQAQTQNNNVSAAMSMPAPTPAPHGSGTGTAPHRGFGISIPPDTRNQGGISLKASECAHIMLRI